jgi:hypothetical protein
MDAKCVLMGKEASMRKVTLLAVAIGAMTMLYAVDAAALPLAPVEAPIAKNNVTLVRDGCGPGYYFSEHWRRCVEERDYGPRYPRYREISCAQECRERRADCNFRRGGYFNGCGIAYSTCLDACH